jgi:threonine synthase
VFGATLVGVRGNYDRVNRLCGEIADAYGWGFVNVNLRPFYGEGSKTVGYEIAEQSGWALPGHVVSPMAGASLITKVEKAFRELVDLGLVKDRAFKIHGAQATGCAPVVRAFQSGANEVRPVKPNTIVRSLAIGDPADGPYALQTMRRTGGSAASAEDPEVIECIKLLAETEGLFGETAGGTVVASARKLAKEGAFDDGEPVVLLITGHGLKTVEALSAEPTFATVIDGRLDEFAAFWKDGASERVA